MAFPNLSGIGAADRAARSTRARQIVRRTCHRPAAQGTSAASRNAADRAHLSGGEIGNGCHGCRLSGETETPRAQAHGEPLRQTIRHRRRTVARRDRHRHRRRDCPADYPTRRPSGGMSGAGTGHRRRDCPNLSPFRTCPASRPADRTRRDRHGHRRRGCACHLSGGETIRRTCPASRPAARSRQTETPRARHERRTCHRFTDRHGTGGETIRRGHGERLPQIGNAREPVTVPHLSGGRSPQAARRDRDGREPVRQTETPRRTVAALFPAKRGGRGANGCACWRAVARPFRLWRVERGEIGRGTGHRRGRSHAARLSEPQTVRQIGTAQAANGCPHLSGKAERGRGRSDAERLPDSFNAH